MSGPITRTSGKSRSGRAVPASSTPTLKLSSRLNAPPESEPVRVHELFWRRNSAEALGQNTENRSIDRKIANAFEHTLLIGDGSQDIDAIMSRSLQMHSLERLWEKRNQTAVLITSAVITLAIAAVDWWTKPYVSLGFLYLFPLMLAAAFIPRLVILFAGIGCAILAELFGSLGVSWTRLSLEALALAGCGLFVAELVRNRRMGLETQEKLRALVETSPAAIVTVDEHGTIELANQAAVQLMAPRNGNLIGAPIAAFLPDVHHALRWEEASQFRASMQCLGHRGSGETFTADVWFSTYKEGSSPKLAAIIGDVTENTPETPSGDASSGEQGASLNDREAQILRLLVQGLSNKEIAARLVISESAVKNTLQQLFTKTGVRTRSQLVRVAMESYRNLL